MDHELSDDISAVASLNDPNRRRLYELVVASHGPVARDDAAAQAGISRSLAAFHLDRLVQAGLLEAEYRRRGSRRGPGAGRPAKLYRRAAKDVGISFPPRDYQRIASMLAAALERLSAKDPEALADIAREEGRTVGLEARARAGLRAGHKRLKAALLSVLEGAGFEPMVESGQPEVRLRNCPYQALASEHRDLTCGANAAWTEGVVDGLGDPALRAQLAPEPGRCCVVIHDDGR